MEPIRLRFGFQHYAWGKVGRDSLMASLGLLDNEMLDRPVAEAWAGAHPTLPSVAEYSGSKRDLLSLIATYPDEILGSRLRKRFGERLPFLLKLLSVGSPLSIQVHPDMEGARRLHAAFPERYPEPYHKPELSVALTETTLLFGFRRVEQIQEFIRSYGPLSHLVGGITATSEKEYLKEVFTKLLLSSDHDRLDASDSLKELLRVKANLTQEERYFLYLQELYPGDVGVFQVFILNLLTLNPREAITVTPNTPHAYLKGDLLECMATSDFVIRAGLTPKPKDIPSLLETVSYSSVVPTPTPIDMRGAFCTFRMDCAEFRLERLSNAAEEEYFGDDGPVLYFALSGSGAIRAQGTFPLKSPEVVLIPASQGQHRIVYSGELFRVTVPSE